MGYFTKDIKQPNAKNSNSIPKTPSILRRGPALSMRMHQASSDPPSVSRTTGCWETEKYVSYIYTKHSQYVFLQLPDMFSSELPLNFLVFADFLHTLFCFFCAFSRLTIGPFVLNLEVLQQKKGSGE